MNQPTDPVADTVDGPVDVVEAAAKALSYAMGSDLGPWDQMSDEDKDDCRAIVRPILAALLEHGWDDVSGYRVAVATLRSDADRARRVLLNAIRERDQFAAENHDLVDQVATLTAERDSWRRVCERLEGEKQDAVAELVERTRERDERDDLSEDYHSAQRCGRPGPRCPGCVLEDLAAEYVTTAGKVDRMRPVVEAAVAWLAGEAQDGYQDVVWTYQRALKAAVEQHQQQAVTPEAPTHRYYSTACLHDLHKECQTDAIRWDGTHKIAGTCKWCQAPCGCPCHTGPAATEPAAHELEIVPRPKMDSDGLVAARCSCGEYESRPGTEATVTKDWRQHAAAKTAPDTPAAPLSSSEPAPQVSPEHWTPARPGWTPERPVWNSVTGQWEPIAPWELELLQRQAREEPPSEPAPQPHTGPKSRSGHPVAMTDLTDDERAAYAEAAGLGDTGRTGSTVDDPIAVAEERGRQQGWAEAVVWLGYDAAFHLWQQENNRWDGSRRDCMDYLSSIAPAEGTQASAD